MRYGDYDNYEVPEVSEAELHAERAHRNKMRRAADPFEPPWSDVHDYAEEWIDGCAEHIRRDEPDVLFEAMGADEQACQAIKAFFRDRIDAATFSTSLADAAYRLSQDMAGERAREC